MLLPSDFQQTAEHYEFKDEAMTISIGAAYFDESTVALAAEVYAAYPHRLEDIAEYLAADEFFAQCYPDATPDNIPDRLGRPLVRLYGGGSGMLTYTGHSFDDTHLLDIEFDGALEELFALSIDG